MRFWIFQNNQVLGPYDTDELSQIPYFSAESLVCPEGRKGTSMGDWQRAGLVPELSLSLIKASQVSVATATAESGRVMAGLPPEPTLKDLAALGSLQEKVSFLENTVSLLQGELRMKDTELSNLHTQLEDRGVQAGELQKKLGALEARLGELGMELKQEIQKAVADERSDVEGQKRSIDDLTADLRKLQDGVHQMEEPVGEIARIKENLQQIEGPVAEIEKLKEELHQIEGPVAEIEKLKEEVSELERKVNAPAAVVLPSPEPSSPFSQPPDAPPSSILEGTVPSSILERDAPAPGLSATLEPPPSPFSEGGTPSPVVESSFAPLSPVPAPADAGASPSRILEGTVPSSILERDAPGFMAPPMTSPSLGSPAAAPVPLGAPGPDAPPPFGAPAQDPNAPSVIAGPSEPEAKSKKGKMIALVVVGALALAGAAAYFLGLIPGTQKEPAPEPVAIAPDPTPAPPPAPPPEVVEEAEKAQALGIAKSWPLPGGKTLGAELEGGVPMVSGLSPWMVEKVREGTYQVNFYPPKGSAHGTQPVSFEVAVAGRTLLGVNKPAMNILEGKPRVEKPKPRRPRVKPKEKPASEGAALFSDDADVSPSSILERDVSAGDAEIDDLFGVPDEGAAAPAQPSKKTPRKKPAAKPEAKASDDLSLDDLLMPDEPKRAAPIKAPAPARTKPAPKKQAPEPAPDGDAVLDDLLGE